MNTKKQNRGLVIINNDNLPAVPNTLELLKTELAGLKAITETQYKTDGNIEGVQNFNIQTETKIDNLVKAYSSVLAREAHYNNAAKDLKLGEFPVFKVNGNTLESVKHDILLRMAVIKHSDRKAELDALVKEGEAFLTKEDQYNMYLQKVAKATGAK